MIDVRLAVLALLAAVVRVIPRLIRPYAVSSDAFYHLLAADRIRENGHRLPERLRGLFFPGPYDYPPLFHVLLSRFPARWMLPVEYLISPAIDVLYVWLCYAFTARVLVDFGGLAWPQALDRAFLVTVLFSLSPALLYSGRGPRAYNANPRILSELLFGLAMVGAFWWVVGDRWSGFVLSVAGLAALLLGSKFGAQVLVFVLPLMALALGSPSLLALTVLGILAALVPYRARYWQIAKGHVGHMALFARIGLLRDPSMSRKSEWAELWGLIRRPFRTRSIYRLFCLNGISTFLIRNPQLFVLGAAGSALMWHEPAQRFLLGWTAATIAVFLVVTFRPLLFLGEPERYVSYSLLGQFALLGLLWDAVPVSLIWGLTAYSAVVSILYQSAFVKLNYKAPGRRRQGSELKTFFAGQPKVRQVLPIAEGPYSLAYATNQEVFYPCGNFQIWHTPVSEYLRIYETFLMPRADTLEETLTRYSIDTIVINKRNVVGRLRLKLDHFRPLFENETFLVLDVPAAESAVDILAEQSA